MSFQPLLILPPYLQNPTTSSCQSPDPSTKNSNSMFLRFFWILTQFTALTWHSWAWQHGRYNAPREVTLSYPALYLQQLPHNMHSWCNKIRFDKNPLFLTSASQHKSSMYFPKGLPLSSPNCPTLAESINKLNMAVVCPPWQWKLGWVGIDLLVKIDS